MDWNDCSKLSNDAVKAVKRWAAAVRYPNDSNVGGVYGNLNA